MNDTQTAESWYQSYVETQKRAVKAETERDALQLLADQRLKQIEELEGGPVLSEIISNLKAERDTLKEQVQHRVALTAQVARLREAMTPLLNDTARRRMEQEYIDAYRISEANPDDEHDRIYSGALAILLELERKCRVVFCETPAQSLSAVRNEALEETAQQ